ncbi:cell division FtsZ family protein, partial [Candidatus Bathyarchaeota archaeon]|nr:cell division FtsZ family protein [Candidatus Bathyarchaeota archaeon]
GALTIGVVTIPFNVEGTRLGKAKEGLKNLLDVCDSVVVIDNNRLRKVAGKLPVREAFGVANARVTDFINNITEALSVPGIMNLDFADIKAIMMGGGICAVGFGEGHGGTKVEDAVGKALDNQLLDVEDISKATGALVHIEGGEDMTLEDINRAGEMVLESVNKDARVVWGSKVNPELEGRIRATVVLAGVDSPFLLKQDKSTVTIDQAKPKVIKIKSKKAVA